MILRSNQKEEKISLERDWNRIFAPCDPFGIPFTDAIASYMVFYPTSGYHIDVTQYLAVTQAAKILGDKGFWVSETEWQSESFAEASHWWCAFPDYSEYEQLPLVLENAVYSPRSSWGLILSHEDHAIVGGSLRFIEYVKSFYPQWRIDLEELRLFWAKHQQSNWLDAILPRLTA